jgi:hypothetical protein
VSKDFGEPSYAIIVCSCAKNEFLAFHTLYCLSLIPFLWQYAKQICVLCPSVSKFRVPFSELTLNNKKVIVLRPYDEGVEKSIEDALSLLDAEYIFFNMDDRPALRYSSQLLADLFHLLSNSSPDCVRVTRDGPLSLAAKSFGPVSKSTLYKTSLTNTFFKKSFMHKLFMSGGSIWTIDKYGPQFNYTAFAPGFFYYLNPPISVSHLLLKGKIIELPNDPLLRNTIKKNFPITHPFPRLYNTFYRLVSPFILSIL